MSWRSPCRRTTTRTSAAGGARARRRARCWNRGQKRRTRGRIRSRAPSRKRQQPPLAARRPTLPRFTVRPPITPLPLLALAPRATAAEALNPAGSRAYAAGKWHVPRFPSPDGPKHNWPLQRGFERYYGTITGAGSYYDPATLVRDNTTISAHGDPEYAPERYYYTHAIGEHAVRFIADHHRDHAADPFFLYVAFTAAHWPMHAFDED